MRLHVRDPQARRMIEEIYRLAWEEIASHFHAPTRQWAGPHSRSYQTLLGEQTLAFIARATGGKVNFGDATPTLEECRMPVVCPPDLEDQFASLQAPREFRKTFVKGDRPLIGTTRLEEAYALGSINRGDFWNQRRALVAYWGTAREPSYLHLRFLHDDYDFAAAQLHSAQEGGRVLAGITFASDGGDRHPSLDRIKQGTIRAKDLRLRFEFGGAAGKTRSPAPGRLSSPAVLRSGNLRIRLEVPYAVFGEMQPRWESGGDGKTSWLDVVLHEGQEREINFAKLDRAVLAVALKFDTDAGETLPVSLAVQNDRLKVRWEKLAVEVPTRPTGLR
jgi:hypothetical protein